MIPYFELVIILVFGIVGLIVGIYISNKPIITIKLTGDPLTDGAYIVVLAFTVLLSFVIVLNVIFFLANKTIPFFIQTSIVDILKAIGPVFLGAITIFMSRREKREEKEKEISEKLASPIFLEIEKIRDDLLGEFPLTHPTAKNYFEKWEGIKGTRYEIESLKIIDSIDDFYEKVKKYLAYLEKIGSNMTPMVNRSFNDIVFKKLGVGYRMTLDSVEPFIVNYWSSMQWKKLTLYKHIILGINSIEWIKSQDKNISDDRIKIRIVSTFDGGRPLSEDEVKFTYENIKDGFDAFISDMEKETLELEYIKEIRQMRQDLLSESDGLIDSLSDHI